MAPLHTPDSISFGLSYVDNFSVTVASPSYEQNVPSTQGACIRVPFAPEKTQATGRPADRDLQLPLFQSSFVAWLGFWFDQRRTGTIQFQKRAASAAITLRSLRSLSSPARGLTIQLALRPRLLYGASIFSPREIDLHPIRLDPWGLQNYPHHIAIGRGGPSPHTQTQHQQPSRLASPLP